MYTRIPTTTSLHLKCFVSKTKDRAASTVTQRKIGRIGRFFKDTLLATYSHLVYLQGERASSFLLVRTFFPAKKQ
jgi:hypothetical protein